MSERDFTAFAEAYIRLHEPHAEADFADVGEDKPRAEQHVDATESRNQQSAHTSQPSSDDDPTWPDMSVRIAKCKAYLDKVPEAIKGQHGHNKTLRAACECFRFALDKQAAFTMMEWFDEVHTDHRGSKGTADCWTANDIWHKLQSAEQKVRAKGDYGCRLKIERYERTDAGNGQHFAAVHEDDLRYVGKWKCWIKWDGKRWLRQDNNLALGWASQFSRVTMPDYSKQLSGESAKQYFTWIAASQSKGRGEAMLAYAAAPLGIDTTELDADGNLFNVQNGTIDLTTIELRPHDPMDLLTKSSPVVFDPAAQCPIFDAFIRRIFENDDEIIRYVQAAVGYSMSSEIGEECIFAPYGHGQNGKSKLIGAIVHVMGDYAATALQTLLLQMGGNLKANSDDEAALFGRRFISCSEPDKDQRFDEAKLKRLTGGSPITAMRKYEHPFTFVPTHSIWIECNHMPKVKSTDVAIRRRVKKIPFNVTIPEAERDYHLAEKLQAEASGILNWMLAGLKMYRNEGLVEPKTITDATDAYFAEHDIFGSFLADCTMKAPNGRTETGQLYNKYKVWCMAEGIDYPMSKREMAKQLCDRGYEPGRANRMRYYCGLVIREDTPAEDNGNTWGTKDERTF
jgi:putative DNA primase/helicase